jgi:gluconate 2-dehydrogenase gamma chain
MSTYNRRDFLIKGGVAAAGMLFLPACLSRMKDETSYRFFTLDEAECVIALCEQIIPADDKFGGATDAGVIFYIDRQLSGTLSRHATAYRENIKNLQEYCNKEYPKPFKNLSSNEQIDIMKAMEKNSINPKTWKNSSAFFRLLISNTMEGFYGSPIHGGNKDYMSFDMLGLEYPLIIGQNRYKKPLHKS